MYSHTINSYLLKNVVSNTIQVTCTLLLDYLNTKYAIFRAKYTKDCVAVKIRQIIVSNSPAKCEMQLQTVLPSIQRHCACAHLYMIHSLSMHISKTCLIHKAHHKLLHAVSVETLLFPSRSCSARVWDSYSAWQYIVYIVLYCKMGFEIVIQLNNPHFTKCTCNLITSFFL